MKSTDISVCYESILLYHFCSHIIYRDKRTLLIWRYDEHAVLHRHVIKIQILFQLHLISARPRHFLLVWKNLRVFAKKNFGTRIISDNTVWIDRLIVEKVRVFIKKIITHFLYIYKSPGLFDFLGCNVRRWNMDILLQKTSTE